jgi:hypothetical protein
VHFIGKSKKRSIAIEQNPAAAAAGGGGGSIEY